MMMTMTMTMATMIWSSRVTCTSTYRKSTAMALQKYATLPQFRRGTTSGLQRTCFFRNKHGETGRISWHLDFWNAIQSVSLVVFFPGLIESGADKKTLIVFFRWNSQATCKMVDTLFQYDSWFVALPFQCW
jgi:hypothetical protein